MTDNNHTTEDPTIELIVLKGSAGNGNFNIDLGVSNYVIKDAGGIDTLTFKNTKINNLEYSNKDGRAYIRDKKTKNIVTFDDSGYAERKINVDKAYVSFKSTYQNKKSNVDKIFEMETEIGVKFNKVEFELNEIYDFYQRGMIRANLLSQSVNNVNSKLDEIINIANSRGDQKSSDQYTEIKKAFSDYTSQLIKLDINHETVIEKININGKVYDANKLLISKTLDNPYAKTYKKTSDLTDITGVRILKDNYSDYTEQEIEDIQDELYSSGMMSEYMAGFKDLGQELGIQRAPTYYDFNPGRNIVPAN
ncbi:TPA: hypothetical protein ACPY5O_001503 [Yersinia enterocolitica]|nr:hypothetical protein [Yersinia enterocolitica]EKN6148165.1 hypothetical protein [Yersinia enterocolitica]